MPVKQMGVQPGGFYAKIPEKQKENQKEKRKDRKKITPLLLRPFDQVHTHSVSVEGSSVKPSLPVWILMHEPLWFGQPKQRLAHD